MSAITFVNEPELLTLTATVELDAAVEDVWQLWANPRLLERWWGPPTYPATFVDHDLTPGGRISYYMTGPDGEEPHGWWRIAGGRAEPPHRARGRIRRRAGHARPRHAGDAHGRDVPAGRRATDDDGHVLDVPVERRPCNSSSTWAWRRACRGARPDRRRPRSSERPARPRRKVSRRARTARRGSVRADRRQTTRGRGTSVGAVGAESSRRARAARGGHPATQWRGEGAGAERRRAARRAQPGRPVVARGGAQVAAAARAVAAACDVEQRRGGRVRGRRRHVGVREGVHAGDQRRGEARPTEDLPAGRGAVGDVDREARGARERGHVRDRPVGAAAVALPGGLRLVAPSTRLARRSKPTPTSPGAAVGRELRPPDRGHARGGGGPRGAVAGVAGGHRGRDPGVGEVVVVVVLGAGLGAAEAVRDHRGLERGRRVLGGDQVAERVALASTRVRWQRDTRPRPRRGRARSPRPSPGWPRGSRPGPVWLSFVKHPFAVVQGGSPYAAR